MSKRNDSRTMSFLGHLGELRTRLFRCAIWLGVLCSAGWYFKQPIFDLLKAPADHAGVHLNLTAFAITDPFFMWLRLSMYAGVVAASPLIIWELWGFISPALSARERAMVRPVLPLVAGLFITGVAFIYYYMLPVSITALMALSGPVKMLLEQQRYFNFVLGLCMAGGILFELPVVLALLGWIGLVDARWLWKQAGYAFVVLMTLAAVITPTGDAFTMMALTVPLFALYLLSIVLVWLIRRKRDAPASPPRASA